MKDNKTYHTVVQNNRTYYIDIARGIALIFLVLGHIVTGNSFLFNWIFSFHMPLFFFLAGMCAKDIKGSFSSYVTKKTNQRLLPYFIITAIGFLICMLIPSYRAVIFDDGWISQLKHCFLFMQPINLYIGQVWFLASLFWAEFYFFIWYKLCHRLPVLLQLFAALLLIPIASNLWRIQPYIPLTGRIPFHMDSACIGAFCYILGFLTKKYNLIEKASKWAYLLIPSACFLNIYFGAFLNGYVNICNLIYGTVSLFLASMIFGIMAVVLFSFVINRCRLLEWYGQHSLPLFASHTLLIYLVREFVYWITGTHYIMMGNVPDNISFLMTGTVLFLFLLVGKGYDLLYKYFHWSKKV